METIFGPDGAMEVFQEAREAGKVRYLGFSAHSIEAAIMSARYLISGPSPRGVWLGLGRLHRWSPAGLSQ